MRKVTTALLCTVATIIAACSDPEAASEALHKAGFTDLNIGGYAPFLCGEDDAFTTTFSATNPNGERVEGVVCSGWFKGATIRF